MLSTTKFPSPLKLLTIASDQLNPKPPTGRSITARLIHQPSQVEPVPQRAQERLEAVASGGGGVELADGLDGPRVPGALGVEVGGAVGVVRPGVGDQPLAQRVVAGDDGAGPEEPVRGARLRHVQHLLQVRRVARLVGVDEDDVVGLAGVGELGEAMSVQLTCSLLG